MPTARGPPPSRADSTRPATSKANRAELAAVLYAVRVDRRALEVRTDSQFDHDHWAALDDGIGPAPDWAHHDLWAELAEALRARPPEARVRLRKVKGHAQLSHVADGTVRSEDK